MGHMEFYAIQNFIAINNDFTMHVDSKTNFAFLAPVAASTPQQAGEKASKGPNAEFEADMGELNTRLATIVDRNSGILNENKHLKQTMDMEKQKYADEVNTILDNSIDHYRDRTQTTHSYLHNVIFTTI